jgi:hypothetical protein
MMQIRCMNCHRPYAMKKEDTLAALDLLEAEALGHYNSTCPHCGRVNRVSRTELQRAAPDWKPQSQEESVNE